MARITLQQAYDQHASTSDAFGHAQDQLDQWSAQEKQLTQARDDAKSASDRAESVLEGVAAQVPPGSIAQTSDGKLLLTFGGQLHVLDPVSADQISADDGSPDDPAAGTPDSGGGTPDGNTGGAPPDVPPAGFFPAGA